MKSILSSICLSVCLLQGVISCDQQRTSCPPCPDCGSSANNARAEDSATTIAMLQIELENLRKDLREKDKVCDLKESLERSRQESELQRKEAAEEAERKKASTEIAKERLRNEPRYLGEWQTMLMDKAKVEIIKLLGEPKKYEGAHNTLESRLDKWIYPGLVMREEQGNKRWDLVIQFNHEYVSKVTAMESK